MKILISGSTGFVGSRLCCYLGQSGHDIFHLVLNPKGLSNEILWNPGTGFIDKTMIPSDINAVINLAGENISEGRWTEEKKQGILNSRINSTKLIVNTLAEMNIRLDTWINASATGFYGNTKEHLNTENDSPGDSFLSQVCLEWEKEANKAQQISDKTVVLRFGVILDKEGGALKKMLPVFESGLGGKLGNGKQYFPWVSLDDVIGIIDYAIMTNISGTFNTTSPDIITNLQFTKALSSTLRKPANIPVPEAALKLMFGQMAEETLLMSAKVSSEKLVQAGYKFKYPDIVEFLRIKLARIAKI